MLCSAVETVLPPGVFMTTIPCRVAAPKSILSTPTPARTITVLDEDEFAALALSEQEVEAARGAVAEIRALVETRGWPFDSA